MRRVVLAALLALAAASPAHAATCTFTSSTTHGAAPLAVSLAAACDAGATVHWTLGDGATADGTATAHTFRAGSWHPAADVTGTDGSTVHYELQPVVSYRLALSAPRSARYGDVVTLHARLTPPLAGGITIAGSRARRLGPGSYRLRMRMTRPGPFTARYRGITSPPVWVRLAPSLAVTVDGGPAVVGADLHVVARLEPRDAGSVRIAVDGRPGTRVATRAPHMARIVVSTSPRRGWLPARETVALRVVQPDLGPGSRGASVTALETRLRELHYALRGVDGVYADDDAEAVLAFQKVNGLARTGRVDAALWRRLAAASVPRPHYGGTHVEVDKGRQVLFMVRDGVVDEVVHVSTGATGNTPVGLWHVYSKVAGWSWVLWYPSYFLRGFAVHGYPDVPAYPASHGCVRVPMWIATQLYAQMPAGFPIYVYE